MVTAFFILIQSLEKYNRESENRKTAVSGVQDLVSSEKNLTLYNCLAIVVELSLNHCSTIIERLYKD